MPQPKFRTSSSKRDMRRAHHALKTPGMSKCPACGAQTRAHMVCRECGSYKGQVVIEPKAKAGWQGEDFTKQ